MPKKYFTVAEAEKLLPEIDALIKKLICIKQAISALSSIEIEYEDESEEIMNLTKYNKEFHRLSHEFYSTLEVLNQTGCIVKDLDYGLIDFYAMHKGEEIFLCWQLGENKITHFHTLEGGYEGRMPLNKLKHQKV